MAVDTSRYNEAIDSGGEIRAPYGPLFETLELLGPGMRAERRARADEKLRELGATFPLPGVEGQEDRVLPADWVPRIVPREHWETLSAGLLQRGRALNAWLVQLHNGHQDVVPEEVVNSSVHYRPRPFPEGSFPVYVYGPDVIHLGDGEYVVLEDNVRVPSGVAYSEAVRKAGLAVMQEIFSPYNVSGIHAYYGMLRATLAAAAPSFVEDPFIVVATGGPGDPAFFEHQRIARECDLRLVTPEDLYISGDEVRARPEDRRVDVIYRRFDDGYLSEDLPGIEALYRAGKVALANAPGVGVGDDKAVFPYVPAMIERYLGEEPILKSARTLWLGNPEQRSEALERLPELVVKPREGFGARGVLIGPEADREALDRTRREVEENPAGFVAQECLDFSSHVLDGTDDAAEAFVDLRAFVLPAIGYVMPGGLTRVASPGTRVVNSSAGGSFKDTWVLEDPA